ncbi:MAG: GNAT family N-acetyltransferase [Caldilineaceae bacterium]|nr:GNAT family N-acetyltransferase [Caldilineaceae bacterium]
MSGIEIVTLRMEMTDAREQAARLLNVAFAEHWPNSWGTMAEAREEVEEMLAPDRIARMALDGDEVVGWIGGIPEYGGNVWELHPLAVKPERQGQGIGRALVCDFEAQVKARGGLTIQLGSDDVDNMTSLANADLYVDTWTQIRDIQNFKDHPYSFYQKMGYTIIGVIPDANGRGKPDIYMAKPVE